MAYKETIGLIIKAINTALAGDYSSRVDLPCSGQLGQLTLKVDELFERLQMAQETIQALTYQVRRNNLDAIMALIEALSAKDPYTRIHSERVSIYSLLLSESLGLDSEEIEGIHVASFLHDIGKIGIPEEILNKPASLTPEEYSQIQTHASISSQIVSQIPNFAHIAQIVRHHHERYDGDGYPDGLHGQSIPLGSRILAIADAFDAMTSIRPYRDAFQPKDALQEIVRCAGSQFDPELSHVFVEAYMKNYGVRIPNPYAS